MIALSLVRLLSLLILLGSPLCGLFALGFAPKATIWKALGLWSIGLGLAIAELFLLLVGEGLIGGMRPAGHQTLNDMPGYGSVLLFGLAIVYFAIIFLLILLIFIVNIFKERRSRQNPVPIDADDGSCIGGLTQ